MKLFPSPDVVLTFRGYAPILRVQKCRTGVEYSLYISAKSLAEPLEELRKNNGGIFKGIQLRIRKESMEQMSKYQIEGNEMIELELQMQRTWHEISQYVPQ